MEHDAPHFIAVLNGNSLSRFLKKFQKLFADSFDAKMDSNFRATAHSGYFLIAEIIQSMKQKPFPLFLSAERQHREDFSASFHAANILLRRFAVRQAALGDNYVFVIAALVPMVFPLAVKASVELSCQFPKLIEISSVLIGYVAPVLLVKP